MHTLIIIGFTSLLLAVATSEAATTPCDKHFRSLGYAKYGWLEKPYEYEQREALRPLLDHVKRELLTLDEYLNIQLPRNQWLRFVEAFSCM